MGWGGCCGAEAAIALAACAWDACISRLHLLHMSPQLGFLQNAHRAGASGVDTPSRQPGWKRTCLPQSECSKVSWGDWVRYGAEDAACAIRPRLCGADRHRLNLPSRQEPGRNLSTGIWPQAHMSRGSESDLTRRSLVGAGQHDRFKKQ